MREGFDKEIDSLLRRTARAPAGARGNGSGASKPATHLDADELAAFAEGALPEAARMNVVSHLADCGECRSLAVNLTRAAGVETELEKRAAAAASPSRERESKPARGWLAALFAPRTLRYVAPALVVCLVAAVSFIALRSRQGAGGIVSLQDRNTSARPSIATSGDNSQSAYDGPTASNANANANTATTTTGEVVAESKDKGTSDVASVAPYKKEADADAPDGSTTGARPESKAASEDAEAQSPPRAKEGDDAPSAAAPAPVEAAKSAPSENYPATKGGENMKGGDNMKAGPPPPPKQADEVASSEQSQRGAGRNYEPQAPDGSRARSRVGSNNSQSVGGLAATPRDARDSSRENAAPARRGGAAQNERLDDGRAANTAEDSRSVAGHRFRREGGAWVDVNYKRSMASTGVRRGTDAYRALVADIPEIGRVAEQLGGSVIVVVRGRAYNIR